MFDSTYFETLADGEEKMKYLKKCIDEADKAKSFSDSLELRHMYIKESVFNGDCYKAIVMFPEYMALFDKHSDCHEVYSFMVAFKWIIEDIGDFYQITSEMAESYFEEFKKRCEKYGYSLRTYYMKKMLFYADSDPENAKELHNLFRQSERDSLSDCAACEMSHDICMEFLFGTEEKALSMLNEMLARGISCGEVPEVTYGKCIEHFTKIGALSEAEHYAGILMPMIGENDNFLVEISHILLLKSIIEPNEALKIFTRYLSFFVRSRNPKMKFHFANAAARFFASILTEERTHIEIKLPRNFELYKENGEYSIGEMAKYFYETASLIAEKADNRSGGTHYKDMLNYEYPTEPVKSINLPKHSTVERTPYLLGIPLKDLNSFPTIRDMEEAVNSLPDTKITDVFVEKETNRLIISAYNTVNDSEITIKAGLSPIDDEIMRFEPVHGIDEDNYISFNENFMAMVVVGAVLCEGKEEEEAFLLLKLTHKLNKDKSPLILDLTNFKIFSSEWIKITVMNNIPPLEHYFYRIHIYGSQEENNFTAVTTGLSVFGSRQLLVKNIRQENGRIVSRIMRQIADYVIGIGNMRDEGVETAFGVTYNNESGVMFGWKTPLSAYGEAEEEENGFAVPFIVISKDLQIKVNM